MATAVSVSATNNSEIDGLLAGVKWSGTITYSFPNVSILSTDLGSVSADGSSVSYTVTVTPGGGQGGGKH